MYAILLAVIVLAYLLLIQNKKNQARYSQQYIEEEPSPLSAEQITWVRASWQLVLSNKEQVADRFYIRLFELDPTLRALFKGRLDFQGVKLITTLNVVIDSLDDFSEVVPILQAMGKRHIIYGVEAAYYEMAGVALIETLRVSQGESFNAEMEEAWKITYHLIANAMKEKAYPSEDGTCLVS